ncbi:MAG: excinuclease ABC subunit UvrA [Ignavibacteriales bacterium]|nr:excinuclease ABC subunit UvrA [Ignavibacteriales bacterium]
MPKKKPIIASKVPAATVSAGAEAAAVPEAAKRGRLTSIIIRGARVHNLKNVSLEFPRNKLVVMTGVSGSGKSSLAFDTIYAEGQRRYVESLSSYARQFLERMDKPDVDLIQGISPSIAIEQKTSTRNPRSTVATSTEIYDYLRLLFGRIGQTYCRECGELVKRDTVSSVVDRLQLEPDGTKAYVTFPLHDHEGHPLKEELEALKKRGFFRIVVNGELVDLNETEFKAKSKKGILVLVDRLVVRKSDEESEKRLADSVGTAFTEGDGYAHAYLLDSKELLRFSQHYECQNDGIRYEDPDPRMFSFNNPVGACPKCQGFGRSMGIDMDLVVPDPNKTIRQGAIHPWNSPKWRVNLKDLLSVSREAGIPVDVPFKQLTPKQLDIILNGFGRFEGLHKFFKFIERKSYKIHYRVLLSRYRGYTTCDECNGARLRSDALNIKVAGVTIHDVVRMNIADANEFFLRIKLTRFELEVAKRILEEIRKRLKFLNDVGIAYLTLDRLTMTLSGGESQRINLATSLGSSLVGSLYVLDEPSIGLHPRDNHRLITILKSLRDVGNSVLVVEHDEEMIRSADIVVDMGPKAGEHGGEVICCCTVDEMLKHPTSLTAQYLNGKLRIQTPRKRRRDMEQSILIKGAAEHNLKGIDVRIPLGMFVCVTGVSGSGKSTLVHEILYAGIQKMKGGFEGSVGRFGSIAGADHVERVELVDQSPIGRSPRSNPVTYLKIFDLIRDLLAHTQASRIRGYMPGHFSFNVPGGRCDVCEGDGFQKIEMQFLADLYLTCESCKGRRFKQEVLEVRYHGKNVDDLLRMTITEAIEFFSQHPDGRRVANRLKVLDDVGLGYVRLGQPATTLSGGEAQRIKLANHLTASSSEGRALFIFDEPTTGLHFDDIAKLLKCFNALVEAGHSLVVIEHNMDVIKCADFIIDLGPEGGDGGGQIVATGTPEELAKVAASHTGRYLKEHLRA